MYTVNVRAGLEAGKKEEKKGLLLILHTPP